VPVQGCTLSLPLPTIASKWQMGFNSVYEGLRYESLIIPTTVLQISPDSENLTIPEELTKQT